MASGEVFGVIIDDNEDFITNFEEGENHQEQPRIGMNINDKSMNQNIESKEEDEDNQEDDSQIDTQYQQSIKKKNKPTQLHYIRNLIGNHGRPIALEHLVEVKRYLDEHRVSQQDEYTNTGMNRKYSSLQGIGNFPFSGKYFVDNISREGYETFLENIHKFVFEYGIEMGITERHLDNISPVVIDLDFRYEYKEGDVVERKHTPEQIKKFIQLYHRTLSEIVDITNENESRFRYFVLERPNARLDEKHGVIKDGVHIQCREIQVPYSVLFIVREIVIKKMGEIFEDPIYSEKQPFSECFDKCVIRDAPWMLYGTTKQGVSPYQVSNVYYFRKDSNTIRTFNKSPTYDSIYLIKHLSIRYNINGGVNIVPREGWAEKIEEYERSLRRKNIRRPPNTIGHASGENDNITITNQRSGLIRSNNDMFKLMTELVDCLSIERSESYPTWVRVGWCLKNIAIQYNIPQNEAYKLWVQFSSKSPRYTEGEEIKMDWFSQYWETANPKEGQAFLSIGSLRHWAKEDNPKRYQEITNTRVDSLIDNAVNNRGSHISTAAVLYELLGDKMVCIRPKKTENSWYVYQPEFHRWVLDGCGHSLFTFITTEMVSLVNKRRIKFMTDMQDDLNGGNITEGVKEKEEKIKKYSELMLKLQDINYIEKLTKACSHRFYREDFFKNLDSNISLFCFNNGVLDLDEGEFRDGKPEDYISLTCGYDYNPNPSRGEMSEINRIINQILPIEESRQYFLTVCASCLKGGNRDQSFWILQNSDGANGKTIIMELMMKAFGDEDSGYGNKFNVSILQEKRPGGQAPAPEIYKLKGKRFTYCEEPDENIPINTGLLKELTGGGLITTRKLREDPVQFETITKFFMCCNHLPNINTDDQGTWRRLKNVYFPSRFLYENTKDYNDEIERGNPYVYPRDDTLKGKLDELKIPFMKLLFEYYMTYLKDGQPIVVPEAVIAESRKYQDEQDTIRTWVMQNIVFADGEQIRSRQLGKRLREDFRGDSRQIMSKVRRKIEEIFRREIKSGEVIINNTRFQNLMFKMEEEEENGGGFGGGFNMNQNMIMD
jgi:hypothetical protein